MSLQCGIVGLPNVGKSTLFNAMTAAGAAAANYPFCTIEPNTGVVPLNDARMEKLASIYKSERILSATMEFVDIAGLVAGASQGEGLGNQFLGHIRSVNAILHVVRCFDDPDVIHVHGKVDPAADADVIMAELMLADLDAVEKRIQRLEKQAKTQDKEALAKLGVFQRLREALAAGKPARTLQLSHDESSLAADGGLLTLKPMLYVANVAEEDVNRDTEAVRALRARAEAEGTECVVISSKIESEIAELPMDEKKAFLQELGLSESGLDRLARAAFRLLHLQTYFTAGPKETRAWTIPIGCKAPQAAGVIHSDFERGFIKAEVMSFDDLARLGSEQKVKEQGLLRIEGKEYVMRDGDVVLFRFNV